MFAQVEKLKPEHTRLTSFSVLMARQKGDIEIFRKGAEILKRLSPKAKVLIAEACSHIPQNEDIGRVKLPGILLCGMIEVRIYPLPEWLWGS